MNNKWCRVRNGPRRIRNMAMGHQVRQPWKISRVSSFCSNHFKYNSDADSETRRLHDPALQCLRDSRGMRSWFRSRPPDAGDRRPTSNTVGEGGGGWGRVNIYVCVCVCDNCFDVYRVRWICRWRWATCGPVCCRCREPRCWMTRRCWVVWGRRPSAQIRWQPLLPPPRPPPPHRWQYGPHPSAALATP